MSKAASHRWLNQNYEQVSVRVRPGDRARLAAAAAARDTSAAALIVAAVNAYCDEQVLTPLGAPLQRKQPQQETED